MIILSQFFFKISYLSNITATNILMNPKTRQIVREQTLLKQNFVIGAAVILHSQLLR